MTLDTKQQIIQSIKKAQNILVTFKNIKTGIGYPAGGDAVASALALYQILLKNNKKADVASPDFYTPTSLSKLPYIEKIQNNIQSSKKATVSINIKESGLKNFSYDILEDQLNIYLAPKVGLIKLDSLKSSMDQWNYDLIFVIDCPNLDMLGDIYHKNKLMFSSLPIINIDHSPHNEHYGEINLVDIKKLSTSEVLWDMIDGSKNIDKEIINCVLAGIIAKTKNFKHPKINSKTLNLAGKLITLGAERGQIILNFYKTKKIEELKLWGRALARLKQEDKIIWTLLTNADFIHCGAEETSLPEMMDELISGSKDKDMAAIIYESSENKIKSIIYSDKINLDIKDLNIKYQAGTTSIIDLPYKTLQEAEKYFVPKLKE